MQNHFSKYFSLPRDVKLIIYSSFFAGLAYSPLFMILPSFLPLEGVPVSVVGMLFTIMGVSGTIFSLFIGGIANRYGKKKIAIISGFIGSLIILAFGLTTDVLILYLASIVAGFIDAASMATIGVLLADKTSEIERTNAFSFSFFLSNLAMFFGGFFPLILLYISNSTGYSFIGLHRYLFLILSIVSLLDPILLFKISEDKNETKIFNFLPRKSMKIFTKYVIASGILAFGAGLIIPIFPTWIFLKFNLNDAYSAPLLSITGLFIALSSLATPFLSERIGAVKTIVFTQLSSTIFLFIIPFIPSFFMVSIIYIIRSFLMNMSNPAENALILGIVHPEERATVSSIGSIFWRLPNSISTFIGAWIMHNFSLSMPFILCTIFYIISISFFFYSFRNYEIYTKK